MSARQGKGLQRSRGTLAWPCLAHWWPLLPLAFGLLLLAGCARLRPAAGATPAPTATVNPQATIRPGTRNPGQASATPQPATTPLTLTIWGPDFMAPLDDAPGGTVLAAQIAAFSGAHPAWQVRYVRKKPYGQGGLTHFLRSSHAVAPASLPDLALVDMSEIGLLAGDGLLQPLDSLLGHDITSDLPPFARDAGTIGEHLVAVQYEADVRFLAYNSTMVANPPTTWAEILSSGTTYLLPIGSSVGAVSDAFLPQYLALGGKLVDRDGHPYLDSTVVTAILEVYRSARRANLLLATGSDLADASACWPVFITSSTANPEVAMTNVNSWDYGRDRTRLATTRVAPLPTLSGNQISLSNGWGWVIITQDAKRQAAAAEFLRTILQPEAMAAWSQATYHLPARRSALPLAIQDREYLTFLQRLFDVTVPQPRQPIYDLAVQALRPAIEGVIRGTLNPQTAAEQAAEKMRTSQAQDVGSQP